MVGILDTYTFRLISANTQRHRSNPIGQSSAEEETLYTFVFLIVALNSTSQYFNGNIPHPPTRRYSSLSKKLSKFNIKKSLIGSDVRSKTTLQEAEEIQLFHRLRKRATIPSKISNQLKLLASLECLGAHSLALYTAHLGPTRGRCEWVLVETTWETPVWGSPG